MALNTNKYNFPRSTSLFYGDSAYDATTAPSNEQKILSLHDSGASTGFDQFGSSLAIGDGKLVVGTVVRADGVMEGRLEVFNLNDSSGSSATSYKTIYSPDTTPASFSGDRGFGGSDKLTNWLPDFGDLDEFASSSIAVGCGRIAVTAADYEAFGAGFKGALYVFDYNGTLINTQYGIGTYFNERMGNSVAIGCNRIVTGASNGWSGDYWTIDETDGNIYIFDIDGNRIKRVTAEDVASKIKYKTALANPVFSKGNRIDTLLGDGFFGHDIAVGHNKIVVGAPGFCTLHTGSSLDEHGAAIVLDIDGNPEFYIEPPDGYTIFNTKTNPTSYKPMFGFSVAIGHGLIAVSAIDDTDPNSTVGTTDGLVAVYDLKGKLQFVLQEEDTSSSEYKFGYDVEIADGRIYVSSAYGYYDDVLGSRQHYTFVYDLQGNLITRIVPSDWTDGTPGDQPNQLAAGDGYLAIGAPGDNNANGTDGGAVYLYETPKQNTVLDILDKIVV